MFGGVEFIHNHHIIRSDAQFIGHDLCDHCFMALSLRSRAHGHADLAPLVHLDGG